MSEARKAEIRRKLELLASQPNRSTAIFNCRLLEEGEALLHFVWTTLMEVCPKYGAKFTAQLEKRVDEPGYRVVISLSRDDEFRDPAEVLTMATRL